ncbi:MAG: CvpA family protein [Chloroflexota bacterium]
MNWLDIVVLVIMIISILVGLKIGLIKALLSLAGSIVGVILAGHYYVPLSELLSFIPQASLAKIVAFAIIFIGIMVIASVLAVLLKWAVSAIMLGWVNHLGGAIFGLVMGAIFCGALLAIWVRFSGDTTVVSESYLAAILLDRFPLVLALLPDEFDMIRSFFQ